MTDETTSRARIETSHGDAETAREVARALCPDNTAEMHTRVEDDRIVTVIERHSTGSLQTTADDYVVNLQTGVQIVTRDREPSTTETHDT
jgi:hypothetical protein